MEETWIWYGPSDAVTLEDIKQTGAKAVSSALYHKPAGEIWSLDEIVEYKENIESSGLSWSVVESIPVHETLKTGIPESQYDQLLENFKISVSNLGKAGLNILSYSFSPLFDWLRTDLEYNWHDGSLALRFSMDSFRIFDLYIVERENSSNSYTQQQIHRAKIQFSKMSEDEIKELTQNITSGLHGQKAYSIQDLKDELKQWDGIDKETLRRNHYNFVKELLPVAKKGGVFLSVHPDDPPRSILGLPNVLSTADDFRQLFENITDEYNGMTFCVGSLASRIENDVSSIAEEFSSRVRFVHVRNVILDGEDNDGLIESGHLEGRADLVKVIKEVLSVRDKRIQEGKTGALTRLPFRSDHGHLMLQDIRVGKGFAPGHSLMGRLRGLAEVRGIQAAFLTMQQIN